MKLSRALTFVIFTLATVCLVGILVLLQSKQQIYDLATNDSQPPEPFPVTVDPVKKTIAETASADGFFTNTSHTVTNPESWLEHIAVSLRNSTLYQQLGSPVSRVFVIWPGERREQITTHIGGVLHWNQAQRQEFETIYIALSGLEEGAFPPGQYVSHRYATPAEVALLLHTEHQEQVLRRYTAEVESVVSLKDALTIASLLEREARGADDIRIISGIIWNRLFIDMPLQLDATLQYAKANQSATNWWPAVRPADKFIESPYNTYENKGLPAGPIANPSVEAIVAALNPVETSCLYYFHGPDRAFYCNETYEEHVAELRTVY